MAGDPGKKVGGKGGRARWGWPKRPRDLPDPGAETQKAPLSGRPEWLSSSFKSPLPVTPSTRRRLRFLGGFLLYFCLLWILWDTAVVYPLKIFVVLLHEASHALAAVATGGQADRIVLDPFQGGVAYTRGGNRFLILSAGYLGSLLWGAALVFLAFLRRPRPRWLVGGLGVAVVLFTVGFVRSWFGLVFGLTFGAGLLAVARYFSTQAHRAVLLGLGLTSVLYAILDIKSDILDRPHLRSDAAVLGEMTGIPTLVWGVLWMGLALAVGGWLLRWMWRRL